jgi:hypothetical protein
MQSDPYWHGIECLAYGTVCDGVYFMRDGRDRQEKNTLLLYQVLGVLVLLVVMAQAFMYMGYMIGELL